MIAVDTSEIEYKRHRYLQIQKYAKITATNMSGPTMMIQSPFYFLYESTHISSILILESLYLLSK